MKALILVGGKATRLLPLTCNIPKAMVPVLNTPFLEHVIRHLSQHGIKEIILAQGHLSQPIEGYLGNGSHLGVRLYYSFEEAPLGTAGAVKNAERYLGGTFVTLNGDVFTDQDITDIIDFHQKRKAKATIALTPVADPTAYGVIETDAESRVTHFREKPSWSEVTTNMVNAGIYILEPNILAQIPAQANVSIEREVFPRLITQGEPVYAYSSSAYWMDMGTPEKYLQLHWDLLSGKCKQRSLVPDRQVLIGEHSDIHPSAQIKGPVVIGANGFVGRGARLSGPVVIGNGCTILEDSIIEQSVIWNEARIGPGAKVKNSIVADHCCLKAACIVEGAVLGDNVTVNSGAKLELGSKIWPGTIVEAKT